MSQDRLTIEDYKKEIEGLSVAVLKEQFAQLYLDFFAQIGRLAVRLVAIEDAGDEVSITCTPSEQAMVRRLLNTLRKFGRGEIVLEAAPLLLAQPTQFSCVAAMDIESQKEMMQLTSNERDRRLGSHNKKHTGRAKGFTAGHAPDLKTIAESADPRDLAELILSLIALNREPSRVAKLVGDGLSRFADCEPAQRQKTAPGKTKKKGAAAA